MLMFYLVFGIFLQRGGSQEHYVPFLLCGLVTWKWFSVSIASATTLLARYSAVINDVLIEKPIFFVIHFVKTTSRFLVALSFLLIFLFFIELGPTSIIDVIFFLGIAIMLIFGLMIFIGSVSPFFPGIKILMPTIIQALFFISGIFIPVDGILKIFPVYEYLNPILMLIDYMRSLFIYHVEYPIHKLLILLFHSVIYLLIGIYIFNKKETEYVKYI